MSETIRTLDPFSREYSRDYENGWRASERVSEGALDRADARNVSHGWYDGYMDSATGRPKWTYRKARRLGYADPAAMYAAEDAERRARADYDPLPEVKCGHPGCIDPTDPHISHGDH